MVGVRERLVGDWATISLWDGSGPGPHSPITGTGCGSLAGMRGSAWGWRLRRRVNRLNGTTALGLAVARAGGARCRPGPGGVILAEGYRWGFPVAGAFTVGDVVVTRGDFDALCGRLPEVLEHERRHCAQYAVLGLAFLPLYVVATAWSWLFLRDLARGNLFERWAGLRSGGYL